MIARWKTNTGRFEDDRVHGGVHFVKTGEEHHQGSVSGFVAKPDGSVHAVVLDNDQHLVTISLDDLVVVQP